MKLVIRALGLATLFAASLVSAQFVFEDVTAKLGLAEPLKTWRVAHGIAVGDCTGDGLPEIYYGAFADRPLYTNPGGPLPNMLFLNDGGKFTLAPVGEVNLVDKRARTTMALFADLNNDGRLDLIVGNHQNGKCYRSVLFENLGQGKFRDATPEPPEWLAASSPRNISVLDFDRDGLLDLVFTDGGYGNYEKRRLHILRNNGNWTFTDVSEQYGFPLDNTVGMGLAIADVNNDGVQDIFVAHSCRLFVSGPDGKYRLFDDQGLFVRERPRTDWWPCGSYLGDLNGDDLLDLVIAVHGQPAMVFVYLNQGIRNGMPHFTELQSITFPKTSPITTLPIKCAQVAIRDMDNDGAMDIALSVLYADNDDRPAPFILRNLGNDRDGRPRFAVPPVDRALNYYAPGIIQDLDRDGRTDFILPAWFDEQENLVLRNATAGGNWLLVQVKGTQPGFNPMGIGAIIRAYPAGKAGQGTPLARYDLTIGNGYSSGEEAIAHLGLGKAAACDLVITWQGRRQVIRNVKANQLLEVKFEGTP